ncbi:hypothetical protein AVEN_251455-1 [Araneus ventricosus]|uniref:Uncharacterized protein n=1 Tax=Araneus ventricosus TaxID=182803 RepID=A0A4Y2NEY6_ARAVE|nr:hypothetical protein AVEN_251455-1 [Araneus ventricosus]
MQLEFPSLPKPSGTLDWAARSGPSQHDSTSQHLAGAEFPQPTRHQTPQMTGFETVEDELASGISSIVLENNSAFCWKNLSTVSEVQVNIRKIMPEVRGPFANKKNTAIRWKVQSVSRRLSELSLIQARGPGKLYFISQSLKKSPAIYFIFHKSRFRDHSVSKVHFLYSRKKTAPSTPTVPYPSNRFGCCNGIRYDGIRWRSVDSQTCWRLCKSTPVLGNTCSGDDLRGQVRHCYIPDMLAPVEQCCVRYHLQP